MIQNKKLVLSFLMAVLACGSVSVEAQSTYSNPSNLTSSPYTRYGFGKLGNVGNASTRGMGDAGIATRTNLYTNLFNPASLTAIDTLTMLFEKNFVIAIDIPSGLADNTIPDDTIEDEADYVDLSELKKLTNAL